MAFQILKHHAAQYPRDIESGPDLMLTGKHQNKTRSLCISDNMLANY